MFKLDQAVSEWRRQMHVAGVKNPNTLDELESHLREDTLVLVSRGMSEAQAFQRALSRLGGSNCVSTEFKKINNTLPVPVMVGGLIWTVASVALAIVLAMELFVGKLNPLLFAHIFSLTAGYGAAFLTGGLGIYWVCCRGAGVLSPIDQRELRRAVLFFSHLTVGLVAMGFFLGGLWSTQHLGRYWVSDPRAIGGLCACVWFVAICVVQRFGHLGNRAIMLLCIFGNVVVGLAWFGPQLIKNHDYGMAGYWPLDVFLGIHLLFLVMGIVPAPNKVRA